jgi:hypothetical protein
MIFAIFALLITFLRKSEKIIQTMQQPSTMRYAKPFYRTPVDATTTHAQQCPKIEFALARVLSNPAVLHW